MEDLTSIPFDDGFEAVGTKNGLEQLLAKKERDAEFAKAIEASKLSYIKDQEERKAEKERLNKAIEASLRDKKDAAFDKAIEASKLSYIKDQEERKAEKERLNKAIEASLRDKKDAAFAKAIEASKLSYIKDQEAIRKSKIDEALEKYNSGLDLTQEEKTLLQSYFNSQDNSGAGCKL